MSTDISLAGAGYMVAPGTYERSQDGMAESRTGRAVQTDFFGGQRRPLQLERDAAWTGLGVGPVWGGQGVMPWPASRVDDVFQQVIGHGAPVPFAVLDDAVYYATDQILWRADLAGGLVSASYVAAQDITDIAVYAGNLILAYGSAADVGHLTVPGHVHSTMLAGEKAQYVAGYAGFAVWSRPGKTGELRQITGTGIESRYLDAEILDLTVAGGYVYAVTVTGVYRYSGRVVMVQKPNPAWVAGDGDTKQTIVGQEWTGDWTPFFGQSPVLSPNDYAFLVGFGGRVYTWAGGEVLEHDPDGDRAGWRATGLSGLLCTGACVVAGRLWVTIIAHDSAYELWSWSGSGWWRAYRSTTRQLIRPRPTMGDGQALVVFCAGTGEVVRFDLEGFPSLPASGEWVSSLIHANAPDRNKAWRKIGAVFAAPVGAGTGAAGSTDDVGVALAYSLDGGESWVQVASTNLTDHNGAGLNATLDAELGSAAAVSRHLQLRVTWASVSAWAPVLTSAWAEFELLESPARRRRWRMVIDARDRTVDRDGAVLTRDGQTLIDDLWSAWSTGAVVAYTDIDGAAYQVRIIGIRTKVANPDRAGSFGDADVHLDLVEL